jgi:hypothetical protein
MIPYEDLVVALQAWRVKQGLPVGGVSGQFAPPPPAAVAARPTPPPQRGAPPAPPPRATPPAPPRAAAPPPLAPPDHDLDDEYANEGADFAMAFDHIEQDGEATSLGAPPRASEPGMPTELDDGTGSLLKPKPRRRNDW